MAKKRGNGEGTIYKLPDGRWIGQITIGTNKDGKPKRRSLYGKTKKEVQNKMHELKNQLATGTLPETNKITLADWLTTWINDYKKQELKPSTWESYKSIINTHIIPDLGGVKLDKLRTNDIQRFYNAKLEKGRIQRACSRNKEKSLSARTIKNIHTVMHSALEQAARENLINSNPASYTTRPRQEKKEITPLKSEQVKQFLENIKNDWLYPLYITALGTGLRRGELLGLKWQDIDFDNQTAYIKRELLLINNRVQLEEYTKTKSSNRSIALPDTVIKQLKKLKTKQKEDKLFLGQEYQDNNFVFCWDDGRVVRPDYPYKRLKELLEQNNLPVIRFHDLRHTFATLLLEAGEHPKVVSEMLGHSTITITLDTYSHVLPSMQQKAAAKLNSFISEEEKKQAK
ncbi:hypothetical protein SYNTR_0715 [Candidatus Syntrophocurvum alkaliphilum]|uniref:Integrase n=1 Tax=Candidatus Syntrophocurvum alkaliphilum TaxID=2293317 RepID=A0A6I6D8J1_9FIRM|nr:site-specific integrase [Candidatus Syntrophocurvum alkaliphilum]QGT99308.1 hypothetical protein SYNTR_0715 [Candidatus Syntrophocurvum alkaliphilum]